MGEKIKRRSKKKEMEQNIETNQKREFVVFPPSDEVGILDVYVFWIGKEFFFPDFFDYVEYFFFFEVYFLLYVFEEVFYILEVVEYDLWLG